MSDLIYLDYNATTPIAPEVAAAMRPFLERGYGNPSSSHRLGVEARHAVEQAREHVAALLGCAPDEVLFTSGGTESNNMAILGTAHALRDRGRHIVTTAIEHPSVSEVCAFLEGEGYRVTAVAADSTGLVDPADVSRAITADTILVSVMHANNEVGTIQPLADIASVARARGVRIHSDGAQSVGKVPTRVEELGVDLFSLAGHKLYAPKGVGALYIRRGTRLSKLLHGAGHEGDRRAGTENVMGIAGLGAAALLAARHEERLAEHLRTLRDRLHDRLSAGIPDARLNGHPERRLPNTLSISFPGLNAARLLDALEGVAASAGAACHAGQAVGSHVLRAMGVPHDVARGTIRFSTGRATTMDEIDRVADEVIGVVRELREADSESTAKLVPASFSPPPGPCCGRR